ncbi:aminotransferase class I/II-fold pyridoxal phosphate-dependent enzyme [Streptomyces sp. NPDC057798]|uniref:aminotransferase class I/II-fold pyridoxal phosphate-dependent enzyme n=1 Tax=Streptomyces sp. NPDC057798 TaxID=3346252 RepID=UPI00368810B3
MTAPPAAAVTEWSDLVPYLRADDGRWHNLAAGMPMQNASLAELARQAYRTVVERPDFPDRIGRYHDVMGDHELRERLATLYAEHFGLPLARRNVLITTGAQAAFHHLSAHVHGQGRRIVFAGPEYPGHRTHPAARYDMLLPDIRDTGPHEFRYLPPRGALGPDVGAVVLSRPGNPTGSVLPDSHLEELARECAAVGALLVVDNAYGPIVPALAFGEPGLPWADNVVLVQSFSKGSLAGERLGFVLAAESVVRTLAEYQARAVVFPPQVIQLVAAELLADDRYTALCAGSLRTSVRERHRLVRRLLEDLLTVEFAVHCLDGGQFQWVCLPGLPGSTAELFPVLADAGVLVAPSAPFYLPHLREDPHARRCLRIGVTAPLPALERGVEIFAEVANAHG